MLLCVLGDLHYQAELRDHFQEMVRDLKSFDPAAVICIGDLTTGRDVGSHHLVREALAILEGFGCPVSTIAGNHDLEGADFATDEANLLDHLQACGRETPWYTRRFADWTGVFLCNERFRANTTQVNEVYLSPQQLAWLARTLETTPGPVLVACHAPVLGSGLRILPELHLRAGNAYINQNHNPGELFDLLATRTNVLLCFSGHSHLGQHYGDSLTEVLGINFVHCGTTHPDQARDGSRHSRLVEFDAAGMTIHTYCHTTKAILAPLSIRVAGGARQRILARQGLAIPAIGGRTLSWKP